MVSLLSNKAQDMETDMLNTWYMLVQNLKLHWLKVKIYERRF